MYYKNFNVVPKFSVCIIFTSLFHTFFQWKKRFHNRKDILHKKWAINSIAHFFNHSIISMIGFANKYTVHKFDLINKSHNRTLIRIATH